VRGQDSETALSKYQSGDKVEVYRSSSWRLLYPYQYGFPIENVLLGGLCVIIVAYVLERRIRRREARKT